jgi:hypothetical protein
MYRLAVGGKQTWFTDGLLKSCDSWLSSALEWIRILGNRITNRVEGFFYCIKHRTNHQIHRLIDTAGLTKRLIDISLAYLSPGTNNIEVPRGFLASVDVEHFSRDAHRDMHKQ